MRVLLTVQIDTPKGNQLIQSGKIGEVIQGIMAKLQPEAAYFHPKDGHRAMTLVCSIADGAAIPSLAEPFWLELDARVDAVPCMNADELAEGLSRMG